MAPKYKQSNPERRKPPTPFFFLTIAWFQWVGCLKPNDQEKAANKPVNNVRRNRGERSMEKESPNMSNQSDDDSREGMETVSFHESVGSNPTPGAKYHN